MKKMSAILALAALTLWPGLAASAEENDAPKAFSGRVGVAGKYDSNVDLLSDKLPPDAEEEGPEPASIVELTALLQYASLWNAPWHLEAEIFGLADFFPESVDDTLIFGRGGFSLGYDFGANTLGVIEEAKHYTEPDDTEFDYVRDNATLYYKRVFGDLWQARAGYDNLIHAYPDSDYFNYAGHGGFAEIRNTWTPMVSTYYRYAYLHYTGRGEDGLAGLGSPESGDRHTGEAGIESFFARKNTLIASYAYEADIASGAGVRQIGEIRGEDENLESDAEFDYRKHSGKLLYAHRFNDRFTLSFYDEIIGKTFPESDRGAGSLDRERRDLLFLTSVWISVRLVDELHAKARYLYRMNESNIDVEDFQDHIGLLGLEYRF
ncbi:MAG: hypothetical protein M5R36_07175 [Deltaproteobacteria bacterium]|nr:hypothetical protein [Deltaproteobacteria bacterium]